MQNATSLIGSINRTFKMQREQSTRARKGYAAVRSLLPRIAKLPSAADVEYTSIGVSYSDDVNLNLTLSLHGEKHASPFARELTRICGGKAKKSKNYDNTLNVTIMYAGLRITVCGYKPETCVLVPTPVEMPVSLTDVRCSLCHEDVSQAGKPCGSVDATGHVTLNDEHKWMKIEQTFKMVCAPAEGVGG